MPLCNLQENRVSTPLSLSQVSWLDAKLYGEEPTRRSRRHGDYEALNELYMCWPWLCQGKTSKYWQTRLLSSALNKS